MNNPKRYTITAALPYANGPLHLGHLAGVYIPADIYARFLRQNNKDVAFICGSDEHGAAITLRAKKEGISPQDIVDKYHELNKNVFTELGISFDIFHRTSSKLHKETAANYFKELENKGVFTKKTSKQYFDKEYNQFLADRYITGECPKCNSEGAYGDQCEKCGSDLSPMDLINPISTLSGKTPIVKETSHWYLPMDRHEKWLKKWIKEGIVDGKKLHNPEDWKKHVVGQCMSWIDGGLQERAMTRDLDWGVNVPLENSEGKVLYVWFDAPLGYISATKQWAKDNDKDWELYWKSDDTKLVHFLAKDNIVFHTIIFPILLKMFDNYILPNNVPANEFLNLEGKKLSTSKNWAVWGHEYIKDFDNQQDALRYSLISIMPENKDSDFSWKDFQARNNNELVAILGNFVNRTLVLTHKYYNGEVPKIGEVTDFDEKTLEELKLAPTKISQSIENYRFREALSEAMNIARLGNKYLADSEPWKLIKTDKERVKTIMNIAIQITANLTIALDSFLPFTTDKLRKMLNVNSISWSKLGGYNIIEPKHKINKPELLFSKIDDDKITIQLEKLT